MDNTAAFVGLAALAVGCGLSFLAVAIRWQLRRIRTRPKRCFMCDTDRDLTAMTRTVRVCYSCLGGQGPAIP